MPPALKSFFGTGWGDLAYLIRGSLNIWYAKAVLDHAVFNDLNEMLSPGYLRRQRNRAMRSQGQGYWRSQQEMFPERAPEFATAPSR